MKTLRLVLAAVAAIGMTLATVHVIRPDLFPALIDNIRQRLDQRDLPPLPVQTLDGQPFAIEQWRGQVLVLNFWATWCPPCRDEMPEFSRSYDKHKDKSVKFAGIGIDTTENIVAFQKARPVSYPLLVGTHDTLRLTSDLGNAGQALPFTLIVDRHGRIVFSKRGKLSEAELNERLAAIIEN